MSRPICVHCGRPYGNRHTHSETVRWPVGETMPPYQGNGVVVKTGLPYKTANRDTMRAVTMMSVNPALRAAQEEDIARQPEKSEMVCTREIWDGENYRGGYKPFCTLRCALDYARRAYAAQSAGRKKQ